MWGTTKESKMLLLGFCITAGLAVGLSACSDDLTPPGLVDGDDDDNDDDDNDNNDDNDDDNDDNDDNDDTGNDLDTDSDSDTDSDADSDADSDTDSDSDADTDSDTDGGYTYDSVNILVYRFEFPDAPLTWNEEQIISDLEAVDQYYQEQSYGRFTVTYSIHPEIFMGSNPIASYEDWFSFRDFYEASIQGTGVDPNDPGPTNRILVASPQIGNYNTSGGPPLMTIFAYDPGVIAHELGHTLGLHHSKAIEAGDQIIGAGDFETESLDYGNVYCMMGMGAYSLDEYNLLYKSYFAWLEPEDVQMVTDSGTYRIYAFDQGAIGGEPIGLTIEAGNGEYVYWIEYRTRGSFVSKQGILFNLEGYFEGEEFPDPSYWETVSYLLDMTPGSQTTESWWAEDQTDSELLIGETYTDHWGGFKITPIATSEQTIDETAWIEVEIEVL